MARGPVFLERENYRVRRMIDAVRLLPLLGILLCMVPLIWPLPAGTGEEAAPAAMPMSVALRYLFGVWLALVIAGWLLWRRTRAHTAQLSGPAQIEDAD